MPQTTKCQHAFLLKVIVELCLHLLIINVSDTSDFLTFYFMPQIGSNVWIEFENGDRRLPVWSGCFWEIGQAPIISSVYDQKVIKTDKAIISISDSTELEEGIRIETTSGLKIVIDSSGIELSNGSLFIEYENNAN